MSSNQILAILISILSLPLFAATASESGELEEVLQLEPDAGNGRKVYALCATCHYDNGWGKEDGSFPVIAGQYRKVLIKQLADIRARKRENPTMFPFSDPETIGGPQALADVAAYIAALPPNPNVGVGDGTQLARGEKLYREQCVNCHGEQGEGDESMFYPRVQGQHYAYLVRQLKWLRDGFRKNGNPAMIERLSSYSDEDINAVADHISRLKIRRNEK